MELTPALSWDPAGADEEARLGPDSSALADYLLHPPEGMAALGTLLSPADRQAREDALRALIEAAFT